MEIELLRNKILFAKIILFGGNQGEDLALATVAFLKGEALWKSRQISI